LCIGNVNRTDVSFEVLTVVKNPEVITCTQYGQALQLFLLLLLNIATMWLAWLVLEVLNSDLDPETSHSDGGFLRLPLSSPG
jgi:hypothetical protein